jgi:hypothetical protein
MPACENPCDFGASSASLCAKIFFCASPGAERQISNLRWRRADAMIGYNK